MDEEDVDFLNKVLKEDKKFDVDEATFEGMLDRLEKNSGHSVIEVQEAKSLLQEDDELILAGTFIHSSAFMMTNKKATAHRTVHRYFLPLF